MTVALAVRRFAEQLLQGYVWDRTISRYRRSDTGRFVARRRIVRLLERSVSQRERRLNDGVLAYMEGRISPEAWKARTRMLLKRQYVQNAALGKGGWDQLTQSDYGRLGGKLRWEYARLNEMAAQIRAGEVSPAQALNRMRMRMGNARHEFYQTERETLAPPPEGKDVIERRILSAEAESCQDCLDYYDRGWQPAGTLPLPTEACACSSNCRCSIDRRTVDAGDVFDRLGTKR